MIIPVSKYIPGFSPLQEIVAFSILLLIGTGFLFFLLTLFKRLKRLRIDKLTTHYQEQFEEFIFSFLFEDRSHDEVLASIEFQQLMKHDLFREVAVKALVSLEYNYSGAYSEKLGHFYLKSGLVNHSLKQLDSEKWPKIIEGIRDLSTMNHGKSYPRIVARIIHKNPLVKTEVLLAMIKMKGISEILKFQDFDLYLNDWVQSNILYVVKSNKIPTPSDLPNLLQSKNNSLVLLTVRLMGYYDNQEYRERLFQFSKESISDKVKDEIHRILIKHPLTA